MKKKLLLIIVFISHVSLLFAQNAGEIEMADQFRSSGKIYVVIAVLLIVLAGVTGYLIFLDRRIKRIEDKFK